MRRKRKRGKRSPFKRAGMEEGEAKVKVQPPCVQSDHWESVQCSVTFRRAHRACETQNAKSGDEIE